MIAAPLPSSSAHDCMDAGVRATQEAKAEVVMLFT